MLRLLRIVWDEPRPAPPPARTWRDWALLAAVVIGASLEGAFRSDLPFRAVTMILTIGLAPTVLWRRDRPLLMVAIAFALTGLAPLLTGDRPVDMYTTVYLVLLPYCLLRWGSGRAVLLGCVVLVAKAGLWVLLAFASPAAEAEELAVLVTTLAVGAAVRFRAGARRRELERATLVERERLARDLHDTVAHHVSAMAIRAQVGLAVAPGQPEAATDALKLIEAEASRALTEMRAMVRVLRHDEPAELTPGPRVADLAQLAGSGRSGPDVVVEIVGAVDDLPPPVATTVFRLAQESVTNARRHAAHATRVDVRVTADDHEVRVQVTDDGDPRPARATGSAGYGLVGMTERAQLLGGRCAAGPNHPDRGWTVDAVLPRNGVTGPQTGVTGPRTAAAGPQTGVTTGPRTDVTDPRTGAADPRTAPGPRTGVTDPRTAVAGPQTATADPQTGSTDPRTAAGPRTDVTDPRAGAADPRTGPADLRTGSADPRTGSAGARTGSADPQTHSADLRTAAAGARTGVTDPRAGAADPRTHSADPRTGAAGARNSEAGLGIREAGLGIGEAGLRNGEAG